MPLDYELQFPSSDLSLPLLTRSDSNKTQIDRFFQITSFIDDSFYISTENF